MQAKSQDKTFILKIKRQTKLMLIKPRLQIYDP